MLGVGQVLFTSEKDGSLAGAVVVKKSRVKSALDAETMDFSLSACTFLHNACAAAIETRQRHDAKLGIEKPVLKRGARTS